jgi:hypothetical protein
MVLPGEIRTCRLQALRRIKKQEAINSRLGKDKSIKEIKWMI